MCNCQSFFCVMLCSVASETSDSRTSLRVTVCNALNVLYCYWQFFRLSRRALEKFSASIFDALVVTACFLSLSNTIACCRHRFLCVVETTSCRNLFRNVCCRSGRQTVERFASLAHQKFIRRPISRSCSNSYSSH